MAKQQENKSLESLLDKIDKIYGKGSLQRLSDTPKQEYDVIPTGSLQLDIALGIGGFPRGRIVEIYGPESSGKTTIAMHAIANAQKKGLLAAIVDAEHAFDPKYAKSLGIDVDNLFINQPDHGEQALEIVDHIVSSELFGIVVIDSVAALVPKAELEGEMGDSKMGLQARLMSQAMRKLTASIGKSNTLVVFINQVREKIGVMYGNPETTTGGNALKFYASQRLSVRRVSTEAKDGEAFSNKVKVKTVKNKTAPPFREVEFDIVFGEGIDYTNEVIALAVENDIIHKSGAWYSYQDAKIGQGVNNVKLTMQDNPDLFDEIEQKVKELYNG